MQLFLYLDLTQQRLLLLLILHVNLGTRKFFQELLDVHSPRSLYLHAIEHALEISFVTYESLGSCVALQVDVSQVSLFVRIQPEKQVLKEVKVPDLSPQLSETFFNFHINAEDLMHDLLLLLGESVIGGLGFEECLRYEAEFEELGKLSVADHIVVLASKLFKEHIELLFFQENV